MLGTAEERNAIFKQLQLLTDDNLTLDLETGVVSYENADSIERHVGTNLLREAIDSELVCEINFNSSNVCNTYTPTDLSLENCDIKLAVNYSKEVLTKNRYGDIQPEAFPQYIALGHELIHFVHSVRNEFTKNEMKGLHYYKDLSGNYVSETNPNEEYNTVGLKYYVVSQGKNGIMFYNSFNGDNFKYTENKLRSENNINERIMYYKE